VAIVSGFPLVFSAISCREPCENRAYISTNEKSDFALIGIDSECSFEVVLENELDHDIERALYPPGHAGFKLSVKDDEIMLVDLDQGEPVVDLLARPSSHFERVDKPSLITGIRDRYSTGWKIAWINRGSKSGGVILKVLVRVPTVASPSLKVPGTGVMMLPPTPDLHLS
jgi:hypothetical protein